MPTYLVAVDFSQNSRKMLDLASKWAQDAGANVLLVHAFKPGFRLGMVYDGAPLDPIRQVEQEMKLDEAVELSTEWADVLRADGVEVQTVAKEQDAASLILEEADESGASLIFLGRQGHGAIREFFMGSVADAVVRRAKVPVVVVPSPKDPERRE